jgi:hypothetical protein
VLSDAVIVLMLCTINYIVVLSLNWFVCLATLHQILWFNGVDETINLKSLVAYVVDTNDTV